MVIIKVTKIVIILIKVIIIVVIMIIIAMRNISTNAYVVDVIGMIRVIIFIFISRNLMMIIVKPIMIELHEQFM